MSWWRRRDGAELLGIGMVAGFFFVATTAPLAVSMAVSPEALERGDVVLSPPCPTLQATGEECESCGLTRGFCAMSRLRAGDAAAYNRAAPWLYAGFWIIALGSGAVLAIVLFQARTRRDPANAQNAASSTSISRSTSARVL